MKITNETKIYLKHLLETLDARAADDVTDDYDLGLRVAYNIIAKMIRIDMKRMEVIDK